MLSNHFYAIGLILHMISITCFAGGAIGCIFIESNLWKQLKDAPYRAVALLPALRGLSGVVYLGSVLILLSGLIMLAALQWTVSSEIWFTIKMALYVLINLNEFFLGRPASRQLVKLIPGLFETDPESNSVLASLRMRLRWFHILEFSMLVMVYVLSVYKFRM